ncbi:anthranilate synthase component I [Methanosarcina sp. A14]|uniref:Anthranilate synthase component 1 n=2 Tax=Methanosarcina barkeri TaxID=2208 RepID=A0A0E3QW86_METBA|nr:MULTISPECIES: anthranilate synthase component I [Methanosarcina]AKB54948.1 Anthranilate synthase, aminase component [Methanosarcina barkeri MS]AKJ37547.1 anthranilate synthase component I TrpE [Methanosarcina barkeri CM1]OEC91469.1 anthranilate synthase component I [Methanosarcina sp. A14]
MLSFDLGKEEFKKLASGVSQPGFIQLLARIDNLTCSPLELYRALRASGTSSYSYLLESVEKQETKARYSFVGNDPDAVVQIGDRKISLELLNPNASPFFEEVRSKIKDACGCETIEEENPEKENSELRNLKFTAPIPQGKDGFDALRLVFPPANGMGLLNAKRFDRQTFLGGAIGYTAYDAIYDSWLGVKKGFESEIPELQYLMVSKTFVFDHITEEIYIVITPFVSPGADAGEIYDRALQEAEKLYVILKEAAISGDSVEIAIPGGSIFPGLPVSDCNAGKQKFEDSVVQAKEHIFAGDIFQAVLSRKCEFTLEQSPFELYMQLRAINPSPYMYIFEFGDLAIVGASPETLLTVHERTLITNPIAGTCPRGKTEAEDEALAAHMMHDEKERAEHVMLVDLGRNDVRMVTESGSVKVSEFMKVLKYSHVQHIESKVIGTLRPECDQFDAFRAIFPAGTLSGAPKIRAMEIISELEASPRGIYGGGVGYYSWNGDADFAIVIRTIIVQGKKASVQAGAGIVADSDPGYEFRETERKMGAMLAAIEGEV